MKRFFLDAIELYLIPCCAAFLPWSLCFRLYRHLATYEWLLKLEVELALAGINDIMHPVDQKQWKYDYRLHRLIDLADPFISLFRSDRWMQQHLEAIGQWPEGKKPLFIITFHWGEGMWMLRHLKSQGRPVAVLVKSFSRDSSRHLLRYWIAHFRVWVMQRAGGATMIVTGENSRDKNSILTMKRCLNSDISVYGLLDVPVTRQRSSMEAKLFGKVVFLPRGLLQLALRTDATLVMATLSVDKMSGLRRLFISDTIPLTDEESLMAILAAKLEESVLQDTSAWHHWPSVQSFFQRPSADA
ncbi:MAG: hypothetical protein R8M38_04575 [Mariprofundaceae bacterium]